VSAKSHHNAVALARYFYSGRDMFYVISHAKAEKYRKSVIKNYYFNLFSDYLGVSYTTNHCKQSFKTY